MPESTDRSSRPIGVLAGARTQRPARLIGLVLAAFLLVQGLLLALGWLVTRVLADGALAEEEAEFEQALIAERTPLWNGVTHYGSVLGSTPSIVILTAAGCVLLAWRGRGPRLAAFLALAVAGETALFLLTTLVVDRVRPPVAQLDLAPPTSSFPSGHTAATTALVCGLALGLARTWPRHRLAVLSWIAVGVVPAFVAFSRLYRGMHWPTDVAASVLFTVVWLLLLRAILLPRGARRSSVPP